MPFEHDRDLGAYHLPFRMVEQYQLTQTLHHLALSRRYLISIGDLLHNLLLMIL